MRMKSVSKSLVGGVRNGDERHSDYIDPERTINKNCHTGRDIYGGGYVKVR